MDSPGSGEDLNIENRLADTGKSDSPIWVKKSVKREYGFFDDEYSTLNPIFDRISTMTVVIAAIAEDGKKIILAADNMNSVLVGRSLVGQVQPGLKKIYKVSEHTYAMFVGPTNVTGRFLEEMRDEVSTDTRPEQFVEIAKVIFQKLYDFSFDEMILGPLSINPDVYRNNQVSLHPDLIQEIKRRVFKTEMGVVIVGFHSETKNPVINIVLENGQVMNRDLESFVSEGSGGDLGRFSLLTNGYKKTMSEADASALIRKAMQDAKNAQGVGDLEEPLIIISRPVV